MGEVPLSFSYQWLIYRLEMVESNSASKVNNRRIYITLWSRRPTFLLHGLLVSIATHFARGREGGRLFFSSSSSAAAVALTRRRGHKYSAVVRVPNSPSFPPTPSLSHPLSISRGGDLLPRDRFLRDLVTYLSAANGLSELISGSGLVRSGAIA